MRCVNLIPMAGAGRRFADAGYAVPKPLVDIAGQPMVVRAGASLPPADLWVFVVLEAHLEQGIGRELRRWFSPVEIVPLSSVTEGQACTCLCARHLLRPDDRLTIGACDNGMAYEPGRIASFGDAGAGDAWVWTFRHNPAVLQNPRMYGWVDADAAGVVRKVSCKIPLSDTPMEDHAVIGSFTFRRAGDFLQCTDALIAANRRVNGEFYVDEAMNVAVETGLDVRVFEVDQYVCWGTPRDVGLFHYWWSYFWRRKEEYLRCSEP
jgi:dTDP-glucose pyrophosphorylase